MLIILLVNNHNMIFIHFTVITVETDHEVDYHSTSIHSSNNDTSSCFGKVIVYNMTYTKIMFIIFSVNSKFHNSIVKSNDETRLVVNVCITSCQEKSVNSLGYFNAKSELVPCYFHIIYCNKNESEIIEQPAKATVEIVCTAPKLNRVINYDSHVSKKDS